MAVYYLDVAAAARTARRRVPGGRRIVRGRVGDKMTAEEFRASLAENAPRAGLPAPLAALWWDAKGDWTQAHALVDELETVGGMAVHAYLHRKEGSNSNADY